MKRFDMSGVPDAFLMRDLVTDNAQELDLVAVQLARIAEAERRRLYAGLGHSSMYWYCIRELRMSEDMACRRIKLARRTRRFPLLLPAIASGDLSLTTALLISEHLTRENATGLLAAAAGKSKRDVERLLAERFPRADLPTLVVPLHASREQVPLPAPAQVADLPAPARVEVQESLADASAALAIPAASPAPTSAESVHSHPRVVPLAPERFGVQFTASQRAHEQLRYAQALLGHAVPSGDIAQVFERALDAPVAKLEREKFAKSLRTRGSHGSDDPRYVPAAVRRAVLERDQGQCTFVAPNHHRCDARTRLEFDHIRPVAQGGIATTANIRLRCRAHNQFEAECTFGARFMRAKRDHARREPAPAAIRTP